MSGREERIRAEWPRVSPGARGLKPEDLGQATTNRVSAWSGRDDSNRDFIPRRFVCCHGFSSPKPLETFGHIVHAIRVPEFAALSQRQ